MEDDDVPSMSETYFMQARRPADSKARRVWQRERSRRARHTYVCAETLGRDFETCKLHARAAAATTPKLESR